jgi:hypothetical protein
MRLATLPPFGTAAVVLFVSVSFALSFGLSYGVGNQTLYLLPALKLLDPELFVRDWTFTHATHYHQTFPYLAAFLLSLDPRGWGIALGLTVAITSGAVALYALCRALVGPRLALPSFLLLLSLLFATRTTGPAVTYAFDPTLQPSTVGTVILFASAASFVAGRYALSGVLLGLSGLFHMNLLLLAVGAFGLGQLALGRERIVRRLLEQLGPACLVLLLYVPTLLGATGSGEDAKLGRAIYLYVRAPHHFLLSDKIPEFFPLLGWSLVAWGVVEPLSRDDAGGAFRRFGACALGLVGTVWLGMLAALASDSVRALFSWRLEPHAEVVLQAGTVAGATRLLFEPNSARRFDRPRLAALGAGLTLVLVGWGIQGRWAANRSALLLALGVVSVVYLERRVARAPTPSKPWHDRFITLAPTALVVGLVIVAAVPPLGRAARHSSLTGHLPPAEAELYRWMRERTDKSAVFLTPPDLEGARLLAQRAVVVDWKGTPALPSETLAWFRRLSDVTGRPHFRGAADLVGYDEMDAARLARLQHRYAFDYAVIRKARAGNVAGYERTYENAGYVVLGPRSSERSSAAP